jgi:hypothetical protein
MYVNVPWENTWRGIQNNLTSTSTTDSLSAAQGKALQDGKRDNTAPVSGNWFRGTPIITSAGVMEIGQYIDFHDSDGSTADYSARIAASNSGLTLSGTTSGTFSGDLSGNATSATKLSVSNLGNIQYVTNDTHILKLGYFTANNYAHATLLVTCEFWGNQHGSSDIIDIQLDNSNSGILVFTIGRIRVGGNVTRTFYYKQDGNSKIYLYAYVTGGNSYGQWSISKIQDTKDTFVAEFQANFSVSGQSEVSYSGTVGNSSYAYTAPWTGISGRPSVINALNNTSTTDALSAAQGKALEDKKTDYAKLIHSHKVPKAGRLTVTIKNNIMGIFGTYNGDATGFMGTWLVFGSNGTPVITPLKTASYITLTANSNGTITVANSNASYESSMYILSPNYTADSITVS